MNTLSKHHFCDEDMDPMLDLEALEDETQAVADLHNGFLCSVDSY